MARRFSALLLLVVLIGATFGGTVAAQQQTQAPPAPQVTPATPLVARLDAKGYAVGPGDTLSIVIYGEAALPKEYKIGVDGIINFPYLNDVPVADLTLREIEAELTKRLKLQKIFEEPQVTVDVITFRSQSVLMQGQVGRPGQLTLTGNDMTLVRALAIAGITPLAGDEIQVRRPKTAPGTNPVAGAPEMEIMTFRRRALEQNTSLDIPLRNGDIVWVSKAPAFYIEGHVKQTGPLTWEPGMTVGKAIFLAGGISDRGTRSGLKIRRQVDEKTGKPCGNLPDVIGETAAAGCVYKRINVTENSPVLPGDSIEVPQRRW